MARGNEGGGVARDNEGRGVARDSKGEWQGTVRGSGKGQRGGVARESEAEGGMTRCTEMLIHIWDSVVPRPATYLVARDIFGCPRHIWLPATFSVAHSQKHRGPGNDTTTGTQPNTSILCRVPLP